MSVNFKVQQYLPLVTGKFVLAYMGVCFFCCSIMMVMAACLLLTFGSAPQMLSRDDVRATQTAQPAVVVSTPLPTLVAPIQPTMLGPQNVVGAAQAPTPEAQPVDGVEAESRGQSFNALYFVAYALLWLLMLAIGWSDVDYRNQHSEFITAVLTGLACLGGLFVQREFGIGVFFIGAILSFAASWNDKRDFSPLALFLGTVGLPLFVTDQLGIFALESQATIGLFLLVAATAVAIFEMRDEKIRAFAIIIIAVYMVVQICIAILSWAVAHDGRLLILVIHIIFVGAMTAANIKYLIPSIKAKKAEMLKMNIKPINFIPADVLTMINFIVILATMAGIL